MPSATCAFAMKTTLRIHIAHPPCLQVPHAPRHVDDFRTEVEPAPRFALTDALGLAGIVPEVPQGRVASGVPAVPCRLVAQAQHDRQYRICFMR
eukprot:829262-Prymnesium_polylepis.1